MMNFLQRLSKKDYTMLRHGHCTVAENEPFVH